MTTPAPRLLTVTLVLAVLAGMFSVFQRNVLAHPLGEMTINHYSELHFSKEEARVTYIIDFAELSTLEQILLIDGATDENVEGADLDSYLDDVVPEFLDGLDLSIGGETVEFEERASRAEFHPGNWGFELLRVEIEAIAPLPTAVENEVSGRYVVRNFPGRLGWHEIVMPPGEYVTVVETDVLRESVSEQLLDYPEITEMDPLQIYDVEFTITPGNEAESDGATGTAVDLAEGGASSLQRLTNSAERLVNLESASRLTMILTMIGAFTWGAFHALSPGHGKAVVGAYLIGSRGTPRHAAFLGLTVTATHTAGIFALGFIALALSHVVLPETIFPYLSLASGVLVILIGLSIGYRRYRAYRETGVADDHGHHHTHDGHHHHDHSHDHYHVHDHDHDRHHGHSHLPPGADGSDVTWRNLLALGVSGGMVPCPSALVLLLGAIALGRLEFGLLLVVLFSLGLALVLTVIGLLMVYLRSVFERFSFETRAPGLLPVVSSLAIAFAGVIIVAGAIGQTGLLS
jgi:nickel/cobalt transporter (NicO) family protein